MSNDGRAPPPPPGWRPHRAPDSERTAQTAVNSEETTNDISEPAPDSVTNVTAQHPPTRPPPRPSHAPAAPTANPQLAGQRAFHAPAPTSRPPPPPPPPPSDYPARSLAGPAPVPPPPPPVFGENGPFGPQASLAPDGTLPTSAQLGRNSWPGQSYANASPQLGGRERSPQGWRVNSPPGVVVAENPREGDDVPPPLPKDHPSVRHAPRWADDDALPPSERTSTFVGIVGDPLPFGEVGDDRARKHALLRLGTPLGGRTNDSLDPPAVLRTFRTLNAGPVEANPHSAAAERIGGELPFSPSAKYTITVGTTLVDDDAGDSGVPPLPLPFGAGDSPEQLQARDRQRLGGWKGDTKELPADLAASYRATLSSEDTQWNHPALRPADPLPFAPRRPGDTQLGLRSPEHTATPFERSSGSAQLAASTAAYTVTTRPQARKTLTSLGDTAEYARSASPPALPFAPNAASYPAAPVTAPYGTPAPATAAPRSMPSPAAPANPATETAAKAPPPRRQPQASPHAAFAGYATPLAGSSGASAFPGLAPGLLRGPPPPNPLRQNTLAPVAPSEPPAPSAPDPFQPLVPLELYAQIKVAIWDDTCSLKEALIKFDVDEMSWRRNEQLHAARIAREAEEGETAFAQQVRLAVNRVRQERAGQSEQLMPLERYAEIRVAMELSDSELEVLTATDLSYEQWDQVKREWGKRLREDSDMSKTLRRAMAKARRKQNRSAKNKSKGKSKDI